MDDKKKVLVVDDDQRFTALIQCALEEEFDIVTASDGREGMEKALAEAPNLIIMDMMMPNVSGSEMIAMLLADDSTRDIPVIIVTGGHFRFKQECSIRGFISKTTPVGEIINMAKDILERGA